MNVSAQKHLDRAAGFVARGEEFYRKAAEEIVAAQAADPTLTNREIGERFGKGKKWTQDLIAWHASGSALASPWAGEQEQRGGRNVIGTRKVLRDAPMEQVERIIADLPKERQQAVAAAAGHAYHKARVTEDEKERDLTPSQRQEREAAAEQLTRPVRDAAKGFTALGIAGHLEQALEELRELIADSSVPPSVLEPILAADALWRTELEVAVAMAGLEVGP